jgi:hypothetical protein
MKVKLNLKPQQEQPVLKKIKITKNRVQLVEPWKLDRLLIKPTAQNLLGQLMTLDVDPFLELVSKKEYPDYYKVIENPISIKEIKSKIQGSKYQEIEDFKHDIITMFQNCLKFNAPSSEIAKLAQKLQVMMY